MDKHKNNGKYYFQLHPHRHTYIHVYKDNVVELIGPGIFRGNCPLGNFVYVFVWKFQGKIRR